jgi:hypothetical protein
VLAVADKILDRGRLLLGLLIVIPLGALVAVPGGSEQPSAADQWTAQVAQSAPLATAPVTAQDIVANLTSGGGAPPAAGPANPIAAVPAEAHSHGEIEGEVTQELPDNYIAGTPPSSDLAAVLRASERRNKLSTPPPTSQSGAAALAANPNVTFTRQSQRDDLTSGSVDPRVVDLLTWIAQRHRITITSMRTDHSTFVAGTSRVSAHHLGRAVDIAAVDGQICAGSPEGTCGRLFEEIVNQLRGTQYQPSQVIYGYDPWPIEAWNFAMRNHRDHIHVGY